ncbi:MAG TPA: glycosyltransferase family 2 protein [Gemmataceae bacterium]|jgi:GT2 family glycosyltransferase
MSSTTADAKAIATSQAKERLIRFLESNNRLELPRPAVPRLSILLVLYNRAELTLSCLRSLKPRLAEVDAEVVLVDNASLDETGTLLDRLIGVTVIRNCDNRGFPKAVNQAAEAASGEFLLLLNNDTEVLGDSLGVALRFLEANPDVGAAGGRIILLDGTLQEAGCTFWREGHSFQYGRGDNPTAPQYMYQRDVDYCSAAFLMTRRELFAQMGGLDLAFSPGYFEDGDYCIRLWKSGRRVVFLPDVAIIHFENASSDSGNNTHALYHKNHPYFVKKNADWLALQGPFGTPHLAMRSSHDDRFRVLYLPKRARGQAPQWKRVVQELQSRNCFVTVYPIHSDGTLERDENVSLPPDVELLSGGRLDTLSRFLDDRRHYYDGMLASDSEIRKRLEQWLRQGEQT